MKKKKLWMLAISVLAFSGLANADPLKLFGVPLAGATRSTLEPALQKAGLIPVQIGKAYSHDQYRLNGQMPGAKKLVVGYTNGQHFAIAMYTFPSFLNTKQVTKVIKMVESKYGAPTLVRGDAGLGAVTATWYEGNGMRILVTRGWPSTTTYLKLESVANYNRMQAQMQARKHAHEVAESKKHSNAS